MTHGGMATDTHDGVRVLLDGRNAKVGGGATVLQEVSSALHRMSSVDLTVLGPGAAPPRRVAVDTIVIGLSETLRFRARHPERRLLLARNLKAWNPGNQAKDQLRSVRARRNAQASRVVVCASEYFADVVRSRVSKTSVRVLRFGVDGLFVPDGPERQGRYVLAVGDGYPHKSYPSLIHAFSSSSLSRSARLVIAGAWPSHAEFEVVRTTIAHAPTGTHVELAGQLATADLAKAYRGAIALLQWSTLESYCHPLVEATACGTPIVSRAIPVVRELVGNSAALVDGEDGLTHTLDSLEDEGGREALRSASLERRTTLIRSWDEYCAELLSLVSDVPPRCLGSA